MSLSQHIATDPDTRGYAGMTALQVANDLNTKRRPMDLEVTWQSMLDISDAKTHKWMVSLETAGQLTTASLASAPSCKALYNILVNGGSMNVNNLEIQELSSDMANSVDVTTWDNTDHSAFITFANNLQSDGEYYGFGTVKEGHVLAARGY